MDRAQTQMENSSKNGLAARAREGCPGAIYPLRLFSAGVISAAQIQKAMEAQDRFENRDKQPPKPPSRPNIVIGRIALSGF